MKNENEIYEFIRQSSDRYPDIASRALRIFELDPVYGGHRALKAIQDHSDACDLKTQLRSQQLIEKLR